MSLRGHSWLSLKDRGDQNRFLKMVRKQMSFPSTRREIWGLGQEAMDANWNTKFHLNTGKHCEGGQTLDQVALIVKSPSVEIFKTQLGTVLGSLLCLSLLEQGVWTRWSQEVPSSLKNCVNLRAVDCAFYLIKRQSSAISGIGERSYEVEFKSARSFRGNKKISDLIIGCLFTKLQKAQASCKNKFSS